MRAYGQRPLGQEALAQPTAAQGALKFVLDLVAQRVVRGLRSRAQQKGRLAAY